MFNNVLRFLTSSIALAVLWLLSLCIFLATPMISCVKKNPASPSRLLCRFSVSGLIVHIIYNVPDLYLQIFDIKI